MMGFWVMMASALLGFGLVYYALHKLRNRQNWCWLITVLGAVLIAFAFVIATPQGATLLW